MAYTILYVGPGGSDANSGATWALRKLTLTGAEAIVGSLSRTTVYVGPGTYAETHSCLVNGKAAYTTGTVSVTNGSKTVAGSGTSWATNLETNDWFQAPVLASGTDGVTTAVTATSHTFTSAAGNFQAGHIGYAIRINTIGAYIITARASATSITIAKTDNSSFLMVAGTGLTYNVGPESPYKIASVESDTSLTLAETWSGPTFTGLAYVGWGHIEFVGDYTGANTSGTAGIVRVTGSNDNISATRGVCFTANGARLNRTYSGFQMDTTTTASNMFATGDASTRIIVDKCTLYCAPCSSSAMAFNGSATNMQNTVRRCIFFGARNYQIVLWSNSSTIDSCAGLVENCLLLGGVNSISSARIGGITVRNNTVLFQGAGGGSGGVSTSAAALATGQCIHVYNNNFYTNAVGCAAFAAGDILEDYNNFWNNAGDRTNTLTGANSKAVPPLLDAIPFFQLLFASPAAQLVSPFDYASFSTLLNVAGLNPPLTDLRGTAIQGAQREWGALEYDATLRKQAREAALIDGGGMVVL